MTVSGKDPSKAAHNLPYVIVVLELEPRSVRPLTAQNFFRSSHTPATRQMEAEGGRLGAGVRKDSGSPNSSNSSSR